MGKATEIGGLGSASSDYCATWNLNNLSVNAPSVRARTAGNATFLRGWLEKAISSTLSVDIIRQSDLVVVASISIPAATLPHVKIEVTTFHTTPFPIAVNDFFRPKITASDKSADQAGVAVLTLQWA